MVNGSLLREKTKLKQKETKPNGIAFCIIMQREFLILTQYFIFGKTYT